MPRLHRLTHPTLGPATWDEVCQYVNALRVTPGIWFCKWCLCEIPSKRYRARCGKEECERMIMALTSWAICARRILKRDACKCQLCGEPADQVDHIIPVSLGGTGDPDNLRSLCERCHKAETARLRREGSSFVASKFVLTSP